jgi:hypothetical protein
MGAPKNPTVSQVQQLERAAALSELPVSSQRVPADGVLNVRFDLPLQGVSLLVCEPAP